MIPVLEVLKRDITEPVLSRLTHLCRRNPEALVPENLLEAVIGYACERVGREVVAVLDAKIAQRVLCGNGKSPQDAERAVAEVASFVDQANEPIVLYRFET
uniref:Uncharacterized protein n=1 Tax=viral metagenome TaxID=1070528 RepID=A0A6H1ZXA2_9ZZZZ